ncbi:MAG: hypothetical protein QUV07_00295 [Cyanobium sp. CZS 25K]|nr:hypothetical protein [Cyanobium sp. CZS25K]
MVSAQDNHLAPAWAAAAKWAGFELRKKHRWLPEVEKGKGFPRIVLLAWRDHEMDGDSDTILRQSSGQGEDPCGDTAAIIRLAVLGEGDAQRELQVSATMGNCIC